MATTTVQLTRRLGRPEAAAACRRALAKDGKFRCHQREHPNWIPNCNMTSGKRMTKKNAVATIARQQVIARGRWRCSGIWALLKPWLEPKWLRKKQAQTFKHGKFLFLAVSREPPGSLPKTEPTDPKKDCIPGKQAGEAQEKKQAPRPLSKATCGVRFWAICQTAPGKPLWWHLALEGTQRGGGRDYRSEGPFLFRSDGPTPSPSPADHPTHPTKRS